MSFIYNHTSPWHWTELHVVSFTDKKSKQKQVYWLGLCTKTRIPSGQLHKKKGFSPQSKTLCYIHLHTYNYFIGCNHCFKLVQSIKWLALGKKRNVITSVMWDDKRGRKVGNWGYEEEMNGPLEGQARQNFIVNLYGNLYIYSKYHNRNDQEW